MVSDMLGVDWDRRVGGLPAPRYFFIVPLCMPNSLSIARRDIPLRLAFPIAFHLAKLEAGEEDPDLIPLRPKAQQHRILTPGQGTLWEHVRQAKLRVLSFRAIAQALGILRNTVRKYGLSESPPLMKTKSARRTPQPEMGTRAQSDIFLGHQHKFTSKRDPRAGICGGRGPRPSRGPSSRGRSRVVRGRVHRWSGERRPSPPPERGSRDSRGLFQIYSQRPQHQGTSMRVSLRTASP